MPLRRREGKLREVIFLITLPCRLWFLLDGDLVQVAPHPILAFLEGFDEGMFGGVEMRRRVLVFGIIAAADMPADQADAQVDPAIPGFQAVLAARRAGRHVANLVEMGALFWLWVVSEESVYEFQHDFCGCPYDIKLDETKHNILQS
jgi:hypothetical protein